MPNESRKSPKLMEQVRDCLRVKHYSLRTERAYMDWIKRFILFHGKRHPETMGAPEIEAFLTHLAVQGKVSATTRCVRGYTRRASNPRARSLFKSSISSSPTPMRIRPSVIPGSARAS